MLAHSSFHSCGGKCSIYTHKQIKQPCHILDTQIVISECIQVSQNTGNATMEICSVILTSCGVVHIVHSTHNGSEE